MTLQRRRFLSFLPALPLAGKALADEAIAKAAGVGASGLGGACAPSTGYPSAINDGPDNRHRAMAWLRQFGLPDFERAKIWDECRYVHSLDPDIAAKRSWSMSVKILTQRQRNFDRRLAEQFGRFDYSESRDAFMKTQGWWWSWW